MPMPSLKTLINAANLAYQQIREPKEASYLHQFATTAASIVGYADTSGNKKSALGQLADLQLTGTIEEQNENLGLQLETLLKHSIDGSNFKALVEILTQCATLTSYPLTASVAAIQFELRAPMLILQTELKDSKHPFFLELGKFFSEMENHVKELLQREHQLTKNQLKKTAQDLQGYRHLNDVHSQIISERDLTLAGAYIENDRLQDKHKAQLQAQQAAFALQERQLKAELEEKTMELRDRDKILEERQRSLAEATRALETTKQQHMQKLQTLEKNKAAVIGNASRLKKLLRSTSLDLDQTRGEIQKLKKEINTLETDMRNGCADYITAHLQPRDKKLNAVMEELRTTKAQLAQAQRKPLQSSLGTSYPQQGLYASTSKPLAQAAQAQSKRPFQPARNAPTGLGLK